ncbi:MAG: DUF882 domain-containing protein [Burkholderiales bacterium]|nr:DUF882 domain-containing protein [Burkholderiales bacterium]
MTCRSPASCTCASCTPGTRGQRRRLVLARASAGALCLPLLALPARARATVAGGVRSLALQHTHTGERLVATFEADGRLLPQALAALDRFLRDHYSGAVGRMDAQLFEQLHALQARLGSGAAFEVISGFRSPHTNERLRQRGGGGVARGSLHLQGRAIDVRLPGVPLADLRDAALELRAGGVGYYARERFIHLDTGRVRSW